MGWQGGGVFSTPWGQVWGGQCLSAPPSAEDAGNWKTAIFSFCPRAQGRGGGGGLIKGISHGVGQAHCFAASCFCNPGSRHLLGPLRRWPLTVTWLVCRGRGVPPSCRRLAKQTLPALDWDDALCTVQAGAAPPLPPPHGAKRWEPLPTHFLSCLSARAANPPGRHCLPCCLFRGLVGARLAICCRCCTRSRCPRRRPATPTPSVGCAWRCSPMGWWAGRP